MSKMETITVGISRMYRQKVRKFGRSKNMRRWHRCIRMWNRAGLYEKGAWG